MQEHNLACCHPTELAPVIPHNKATGLIFSTQQRLKHPQWDHQTSTKLTPKGQFLSNRPNWHKPPAVQIRLMETQLIDGL
jgi:hypothetical protein